MRKLAIAAIVAAALATATSGAALWRTRHLSTSSTDNTPLPASALVDVPDATNQNVLVVGKTLTDLNLKFQLVKTPSPTVAKSIVISQNPAPGTKMPVDNAVQLTVSDGP
jgi:hypothetical protein